MGRIKSSAALLLVLVAVLFASCASTPAGSKIPAKASADDTLVLFPVRIENSVGATNARRYAYVFSGDYGTLILPTKSGYAVLLTHEPGVVLEKLKTFVDERQGFYGSSAEWKMDLPLPYEPGKIVVAPFMFTMRTASDMGGGYVAHTDVVKASDEVIRATLETASAQENTVTWDK